MKTFAQALDLVDDPERIAEYVRWHERVWPEVLEGLRALGLRRMRIWRHGTRLFMVYEAPDDFDPERDYPRYAEAPRVREWDELMRGFQRKVPGAAERDWWSPMELVFDLETAGGEHGGA